MQAVDEAPAGRLPRPQVSRAPLQNPVTSPVAWDLAERRRRILQQRDFRLGHKVIPMRRPIAGNHNLDDSTSANISEVEMRLISALAHLSWVAEPRKKMSPINQ